MNPTINRKKAPNFSLLDQNGNVHSLKDYVGKWILLYFYPKDDTPGCTKEACGFRDIAGEYKTKEVEVVGISKDNSVSHKKFADKYHLTFTLLSDESGKIIREYGAWGKKIVMGKVFEGTKRISFLIGPDQTIRKEYHTVNVFSHAKEILLDVDLLSHDPQ